MEGKTKPEKIKVEVDKQAYKTYFKSAELDKSKTFTEDEAVGAIHKFFEEHGKGGEISKDQIKTHVEYKWAKNKSKGNPITGKEVKKLIKSFIGTKKTKKEKAEKKKSKDKSGDKKDEEKKEKKEKKED